jgi:hypothetical protein
MNSKTLTLAALTLTLVPLQADFSFQETTKVTGGSLTKMMRFVPGGGKMFEPQTSTVYLKGDRLAHVSTANMSIIDLASETITDVDLEKKTYSSITFAEMREAMEKAAARMQEAMSKSKNSGEPTPQFDMKVSVKRTGQTKSISGLDTREYIMLIDMAAAPQPGAPPVGVSEMETSMWMTTKIPGYDEVQAFYTRMAQKIGFSPGMNPLMMQQRGSAEGMRKLVEEMSKLDGTPVMTITRMKGTSAMAGMMGPQSSNSSAGASDNSDRPRFGGGLAGMAAGGLLGRRKSKEQPKAEESAPAAPPAPAGDNVMMETQSESANYSNAAIPAARLEVPAGLKMVDHPMKKMLDRK